MGENDLERQSEHLEDSDFNPNKQREEIPDVIAREGEKVPKKCNRWQKKISIAKTVSTLAEQVQTLMVENRAKNTIPGAQVKNKKRIGAEAKAPATSHSHLHIEPHNSRRYQLKE
ncbi:hypothetical protein Fot_24356 [Forsythia ovata]|uniref:Uncharacterized protein n=1 Tax=Forsythia ovata TaxID=205694 RepID=A0ABD1U6N8_9LAMI